MNNIVVTGFGVFRDHQSNPSWEAIKNGQLEIDRPNINVIARQLSVSYREVDETVGQLWEQYKPILMVHVGLAAHENSIRIEQVARHGPYLHNDVVGHAPHGELRRFYEQQTEAKDADKDYKPIEPPFQNKFDCSRSYFDIERVCERLNKSRQDNNVLFDFKCSHNAGLYVYTDKFHLDDIRFALKKAIEAILDELNEVH